MEISRPTRAEFDHEVRSRGEPCVVRGLVSDWPLLKAATSTNALTDYLRGFYNGTPLPVMTGPPHIDGRLFYAEDFRRLNFETHEASLEAALQAILGVAAQSRPPTIYVGAAAEPKHWPGLARENLMPLLPGSVLPNLWIGGRAIVGPHNDAPENIACVVAGRRRFRLFPPQAIGDLYVGPLEHNPAGRSVSFVSVTAPDLEKFPRYAHALAVSREAVLEPGDAIYIPSLWWHSVESLAPFNLLANYWWETSGVRATQLDAALVHALLAMGALSPVQRAAWRAMFDHLVFHAGGDPVAHIPPAVRGLQGELTPDLRDRMRNLIRRSLLD
jgi:hypothetical protein